MKYNYYLCAIIAAILLTVPNMLSGQTNTRNYIVSRISLDGNPAGRHVSTIQYYDGYGRPDVLATNSANTVGSYVYTRTEYDQNGRDSIAWLPTVSTQTTPTYRTDMEQMAATTYPGESAYAYSQTTYDALGRPIFQSTPGSRWSGRGMRTRYRANKASSVKKYVLSSAGNPQYSGYYPAGALSCEVTADEDNDSIETYRDLSGNVVLERRDGNNDTYYVYDKGLLYYVLSPMYQTNASPTLYAYRYIYDDWGRCKEKLLPGGTNRILYAYDPHDRLAYMQDSVMRAQGICRFFLYDGLDRLVVQGTCGNTPTNPSTPSVATVQVSSYGLLGTGYIAPHNLMSPSLEIVNYYDDYAWRNATLLAGACSGSQLYDQAKAASGNPFLCQTAQAVATNTGAMLFRSMYYDGKGRMTDRREKSIDGFCVQNTLTYSYTDKPLTNEVKVTRDGSTFGIIRHFYTYDANTDMLKKTELAVNNDTRVTVADNSYDGLGRLRSTTTNGTSTTTYRYDLHGWPTYIKTAQGTTELFEENLYYSDGGGTPRYNGNISSISYKSGHTYVYSGFRYEYDGMNRLTSAVSYDGNPTSSLSAAQYSEEMTYNKNGSVTSLVRKGKRAYGNGIIDNLTMTYDGNQLKNVSDNAGSQTYSGGFDFKEGNTTNVREYYYYPDGSLMFDRNKGISLIEYDLGGMPTRVQFRKGHNTEYAYAADGTKLRTLHRTAINGMLLVGWGNARDLTPSETLATDSTLYIGGLEIYGPSNARYYFGNGYISMNAGDNSYHFFALDHVGSIRKVYDENGNVEQTNNYFAYGGLTNDVTAGTDTQTHKFGGKELDRMHGLDFSDFSARQYDPAICQFTSMDPLCEKYYHISPYAYCANNPVNFADPNGDSILYDMNGVLLHYMNGNFYNNYNEKVYLDIYGLYLLNALNELGKTSAGKEIIAVLNGNKNVSIQNVANENQQTAYGRLQKNGHRINSVIDWDYSRGGVFGGNATTSLGHELAHTYDEFCEKSNYKIYKTQSNEKERGIVPMYEIFAVHMENRIRKDMKLPFREYYYLDSVTGKPSGQQLLKDGRATLVDLNGTILINTWKKYSNYNLEFGYEY